ncbi:hypothetical protein AMS68_005334 [Peltaster fructicola]|uniref:Uncharacterized protein n=1 Tax=Peltaster fructicola TaxID=286661 RepID=A0A6H0XYG5_9PEZI|nr:hypothetical protein AMS68_005334 [Peltaster fructicola]
MPVYLLHGFRWPRGAIRIHIILQNLDDAAAEWLVAPATTSTLLNNFQEIYSECMEYLTDLRFVEQYDPNDTASGAGSQPYAYVADVCQEIKLGVDIDEVRGKGVPNDQWAAMMELRDQLAPSEKVAWYVVVCGDEDRWAPGLSASSESIPQDGSTGASQNDEDSDISEAHSSMGNEDATPQIRPSSQEEQAKGFKKFFTNIGKRKSRTNLESTKSIDSMNMAVRDNQTIDPKKQSGSLVDLSNASRSKTRVPSPDEAKHIIPEGKTPAQKTSMPQLQTHDIPPQVNRNADSLPASPGRLSLIPDEEDEDQEIITGPTQEDDDDLAAPAPTVRHGKQQDLVQRRQKRASIASFTSIVRGSSPDTLRNAAPLVRAHQEPYSQPPVLAPVEQHQPHQLQQELLPEDIPEEQPSMRNISPPASYIPTGAPPSIRTSRSSSPVKTQGRQRSSSRLAALNALEGNAALDSSPPRRTAKGVRSRRSSVQSAQTTRQSQYSMSAMSNALSQMYAAHERDFNKNRQSVTQEDLVARGLDNMDFSALR